MGQKVKAYKVVISGTYRNSKKEYIDYENLKGVIPFCDLELAEALVRKRFAAMWLAQSKKYPERAVTVREVFIDSIEETEAEFSYVGKDIREMDYEELQHLAVAKDLRAIPLYKKGGVRQAQMVAYAEFSTKVLGVDVDHREVGFNLTQQKPIVVDAATERDIQKKVSNEEMIQMEQDNESTEAPVFSRDELEKLAQEKNIAFHPAITDAKLHAKIFNAG